MRKKNELSLGEAIQAFMKKNNLQDKAEMKKVTLEWDRVMGRPVAENTEKVWFNDSTRVLYVMMKTPAWKNEMRMAKTKIKQIINKELGMERVREVQVL